MWSEYLYLQNINKILHIEQFENTWTIMEAFSYRVTRVWIILRNHSINILLHIINLYIYTYGYTLNDFSRVPFRPRWRLAAFEDVQRKEDYNNISNTPVTLPIYYYCYDWEWQNGNVREINCNRRALVRKTQRTSPQDRFIPGYRYIRITVSSGNRLRPSERVFRIRGSHALRHCTILSQ